MHVISNAILPGDLVFDVGAHNGEKSAWFLRRGARVVCVEPQPAMVARLKSRFADNGDVVIVPKGLGRAPGRLEMSINSQQPVLSTFSEDWKTGRFAGLTWDKKVEVEITTLDQLVFAHGVPRYTKIDVEGFEAEVLSGLSTKIGCISFEFTGEYVQTAIGIVEYLAVLGYTHFNISLGESDEFTGPEWLDTAAVVLQLETRARANVKVWGDVYCV
jgi:FkbM family methyltransferase